MDEVLVEVELVQRQDGANLFRIADCPYCNGVHTHGAGQAGDDPSEFANHPTAHCDRPRGYTLLWLGKVARKRIARTRWPLPPPPKFKVPQRRCSPATRC